MTSETHRRLLPIAAMAMPIIAARLISFLLGGGGPAVADAAPAQLTPEGIMSTISGGGPLTEDELAAVAHIASLREREVECPLLFDALPTSAGQPDPVALPPPPLHVIVRAIMRTSGGNIALIDDDLHRAGDALRVDEDWIVESIDAERGVVTFYNASTAQIHTAAVRPVIGD